MLKKRTKIIVGISISLAAAAFIGITVWASLIIGAGIAGLSPLPDKERYSKINEIKDSIDYKSIGAVVESRYDEGDGILAPSFYRAKIEGDSSFDLLVTELQKKYPEDCGVSGDLQLRCRTDGVGIKVTRDDVNTQNASLSITDGSSGRY